MQVLLLLSASLFACRWGPSVQGVPLQEVGDSVGGKEGLIADGGRNEGSGEEFPEDVDFEDDDGDGDDDYYGKFISGHAEPNVNSVRHFHEKRGEILIPCFGMWWPVGGPSYYDYVGDYYGDGRKKRRRSRKQKKAAKMKKKKS